MIAVFGGNFNPPTIGHINVVNKLKFIPEIEWVLIAPAYTHRFKKEMERTFEERIEMCKMSFDPHFAIVSDIEKDAHNCGSDGSTRFLYEHMRGTYPDIAFVIGLDNALSIRTWKDPEWIIDNIPFIVVSRNGYNGNDDWFMKSPHRFVKIDPIDTSSTIVRDLVKLGDWDSLHNHIPANVMDYIKRNNMYV